MEASVPARSACAEARATLDQSVAGLTPWRDATADSYWTRVSTTTGAVKPEALLPIVVGDTRQFERAIDAVETAWRPYAACQVPVAAVPADPIGQNAVDQARRSQLFLEQIVGRLLDAYPRNKVQLARAAWVMPVPTKYYVVLQPTAIFVAPNPVSARLAPLRKGARVAAVDSDASDPGPAETGIPKRVVPPPDWIGITLNDGSRGYVTANLLKAVTPNASAVDQVARAKAARAGEGDPVIALALTVRETIPQQVASLADLIASDASETGQHDDGMAAIGDTQVRAAEVRPPPG